MDAIKQYKYYILLSVFLYIQLLIVPDYLNDIYPKKPEKEILLYIFLLFVFVFTHPESFRIREKPIFSLLAVHVVAYVGFIGYFFYLVSIYPFQPLPEGSILLKIAKTVFPGTSGYLTGRYIVGYVSLAILCHLPLLLCFAQVSKVILKAILAMICSIVAIVFSNIFLWKYLSGNVAKVNIILLDLFGFDYIFDQSGRIPIIGTNNFEATVEYACSGLEGISTFMIVFFAVFVPKWKQVRASRAMVFAIVGLFVMYLSNISRIFTMIMIGHYYDSQTAVDLWHSYGGLIFYIGVILVLISMSYQWVLTPKTNFLALRRSEDEQISVAKIKRNFREGLERIPSNMLEVVKFPVDVLRLIWHTLYINFLKSPFSKKNCQAIRKEQKPLCSLSIKYESPDLIRFICPLIDLKNKSSKGHCQCNAVEQKTPMYPFRSMSTIAAFAIVLLFCGYTYSQYNSDEIFGKKGGKEEIQRRVAKYRESGIEFFEKELYIEATRKFYRALQYENKDPELYSYFAQCLEKLEKNKDAIEQYAIVVYLQKDNLLANTKLANYYIANDGYKYAEQSAKNVPEKSRNANLIAILAACSLQKQNFKEAKKLAKQALAKDPKDPLANCVMGIIACKEDKPKQAEKHLYPLIENSEYSLRAGQKLALYYVFKKDAANAQRVLTKLSSHNPSDPTPEYCLAEMKFSIGKDREAMEHLKLALAKANNPNIIVRIVSLMYRYKKRDAALAEALKQLKKDEEQPGLNLVAAQIYFESKLFSEMEKHCNAIMNYYRGKDKVDVSHILGVHTLAGKVALGNKKWQLAINSFQSILDLQPENPESHYLLAEVYRTARRFKEASRHFNQAIKINPKKAKYYSGLAKMYVLQKDYRKAYKKARKALKLDKNNEIGLVCLGHAYFGLDKKEKAKKVYQKIIDNKSKYLGWASNSMAWIYVEEQKYEKAMRYAQIALATNRFHPEYLDMASWILFKQGQIDKAYNISLALIKRHPTIASIHYHYGAISAKKGQKKKAIQHLEIALQLEPKSIFANDIKKLLRQLSN